MGRKTVFTVKHSGMHVKLMRIWRPIIIFFCTTFLRGKIYAREMHVCLGLSQGLGLHPLVLHLLRLVGRRPQGPGGWAADHHPLLPTPRRVGVSTEGRRGPRAIPCVAYPHPGRGGGRLEGSLHSSPEGESGGGGRSPGGWVSGGNPPIPPRGVRIKKKTVSDEHRGPLRKSLG